MGMLTTANTMSLIAKGKLDVTDDVSKAIYRKFKQVRRFYTMFCWATRNSWNETPSFWRQCEICKRL